MKRITSIILAVFMLVSVVVLGAEQVSAETVPGETVVKETVADETVIQESTANETVPDATVPEETTVPEPDVMRTSKDAINVLKGDEGFSTKPYWDYAQWTVGYGTRCPDDKLEYYRENGISQEEAEALLQLYLARFEEEIHKFMNRTGVTLTQQQFDALMMLSYNCGSAWSYDTKGNLYNAVISGATGSDVVYAFSRWCNAGGQIKTSLLKRRLRDANMYLNGVYSRTTPDYYGYVLYDACGGTTRPNVQGYDIRQETQIIPTPTYTGFTFQGWYTARVDGTKVEVLNETTKNLRLYAHWLDGEGNDPSAEETEGVTVMVTSSHVNVRQGPGTSYPSIRFANSGEQLVITETQVGGNYTWGKFYDGWICLKYTNYDEVTNKEQETPSATSQMGTVKVSSELRVRSGPSTGYSVVTTLKNGARVEILEQKIIGSMVWGKIAQGWISLDYVVLDPVKEETQTPEQTTPTEPPVTEPPATEPPVTEPPVTEPPVTEPPVTEPPATEPPVTEPPVTEPPAKEPEDTAKPRTGTVKVTDTRLRIRSGPGTSTKVVGYLSNNEKVTITEITTTATMTWGKIEKGWISLDYVVLDAESSGNTETPKTVVGTVKVGSMLRVRKGPSTSYAIAGYLKNNDKVEITEQRTVGSTVWGKTAKGWISMDYVVLAGQSDTSDTPTQTVTKTVTASCLRVRSAAGTSNKIVGYLYSGAKVQIMETKQVGSVTWGRIAKGWISMEYVK